MDISRQEKIKHWELKSIGVPESFCGSNINNFQVNNTNQKSMLKAAYNFMTKDSNILLLSGGTGVGKTHIAVSILAEEPIEQIKYSRFIKYSDLLTEIKASYNNYKYTEWEIINKYRRARILVLDEFGMTKNTEWSLEKMYDVIDYRFENKKKTILTTNLTLDDVTAYTKVNNLSRLNSRIFSKNTGNIILRIESEDWRLK